MARAKMKGTRQTAPEEWGDEDAGTTSDGDRIDPVEKWRSHFIPLNSISASPPDWLLPGLLPPGMTLVVGDPKTFKSRLVLHMCAAITDLIPLGDPKKKIVPRRKGTAMYFPAEQSANRLRYIYETKVLNKKMGTTPSWNFVIARNPLYWQIDEPVTSDCDWVELIEEWKPALIVIDPLVSFHSIDENDPGLIRPLLPIRAAVLKYGGSLVIVHHARKQSGAPAAQAGQQWSRVRGTSALWGMADGGIMASKTKTGAVNLQCEYKDFPESTLIWRPQ